MKKQIGNLKQNWDKMEQISPENYNPYAALGALIAFHIVVFIFVDKYYYVAGVNMYMNIPNSRMKAPFF